MRRSLRFQNRKNRQTILIKIGKNRHYENSTRFYMGHLKRMLFFIYTELPIIAWKNSAGQGDQFCYQTTLSV